MSFGLGELASSELAGTELARDGATYADISAAGNLQLSGAADLGVWADAGGQATLQADAGASLTMDAWSGASGALEIDASASLTLAAYVDAAALLQTAGSADMQLMADLPCAAALQFDAGAVMALYADASASASLGVQDAPDALAVINADALADAQWMGTATGSLTADARGTGAVYWQAMAGTGYTIGVTGSATVTFTGTTSPLTEPEGRTQLLVTAQADAASLVRFSGTGSFGFMGSAAMGAMAYTRSQETLTFTTVARATRVVTQRATGMLRFDALGRVTRVVDSRVLESLSFTGTAQGAALVRAQGSAQLSFAAVASADATTRAYAVAVSQMRFTGVASMAANVLMRPLAQLRFAAQARMDLVRETQAQAQLKAQGTARFGGVVLPSLPRAYQTWVVPAQQGPFVVPPEKELEAV